MQIAEKKNSHFFMKLPTDYKSAKIHSSFNKDNGSVLKLKRRRIRENWDTYLPMKDENKFSPFFLSGIHFSSFIRTRVQLP